MPGVTLIEALQQLSAGDLARVWSKISGLISDVPLTPELSGLVSAYESEPEHQQRLFYQQLERLLDKARRAERIQEN